MEDNAAIDALNGYVRFARRTGALRVLAPALTALAAVRLYQGRLDEAEAAWDEGRALGQATGTPGSPGPTNFLHRAGSIMLARPRGRGASPLGQDDR